MSADPPGGRPTISFSGPFGNSDWARTGRASAAATAPADFANERRVISFDWVIVCGPLGLMGAAFSQQFASSRMPALVRKRAKRSKQPLRGPAPRVIPTPPAFSRPPMMAMVAGTAPLSRMSFSTFSAVSTF